MKNRIKVTGRVQGVGFRFMTKILADKLGVLGTVKNETDGSVTIEAIAEEDVMQLFIKQVKKSPSPSGRVSSIEVKNDVNIKEINKFEVIY